MAKKRVLVIFKTHLDVGFTDLAGTVTEKYLSVYLPNAIRVGYELKDTKTPFIWTVGSWLVWRALQRDEDGSVARAIQDGVLRWHALPFTTHTELMSPKLFEYGLSLSGELDRRFGLTTVGAKMSDVPGHTVGMIPLMRRRGISFLHIGVNPATPLPPVPKVFRWKRGEDEIRVMYQGDYGEVEDFGDFAVYFAHTGDNLGPQDAESVIAEYGKVRVLFPDAEIRAATIDDLAREVAGLKGLPVVESEIGDTWIHGAGTDPEKVSRYRKVLRKLDATDGVPCDLSDSLLMVPEHTWGMDLKTFFHDDRHYSAEELAGMPTERATIERSWKEQRAYVERAEKLLGVTPDYPVLRPDLSGWIETEPTEIPYEVSWQLFDNTDYERYKRDYMRCFLDWAIWDFTKVGLPDYKGFIAAAKVAWAYRNGEKRAYRLRFDEAIGEQYGLPELYLTIDGSEVVLKWFGKRATRYPQAFWFKFKGLTEAWEIHKMGQWIRPDEIVGSPLICAVDEGVRNDNTVICPLDSPLIAPYGRRLLQYGVKGAQQDLYFNLYNNIWNTNFPMWYEGDGVARFAVIPRTAPTAK